jgi:hypothetical protein
MNATSAFSITENPQFSLRMTANSTYSYYLAGNLDKANNMNAYAVDGISSVVEGISTSILSNSHYTTTRTHNFSGSEKEYQGGTTTYNGITLDKLGETELSTSFTFDGVRNTATKKVYITGLPFDHQPPSTSVWTKDGKVNDNSGYVRFGQASSGDQALVFSKVSIPENTKVNLIYDFKSTTGTVGLTFSISIGSQTFVSEKTGDMWKEGEYKGEKRDVLTTTATQIRCHNSYGAGNCFTDLYRIALSYSN